MAIKPKIYGSKNIGVEKQAKDVRETLLYALRSLQSLRRRCI